MTMTDIDQTTEEQTEETGTLIVPQNRDLKRFFQTDTSQELDACVAAIKERASSEVFDMSVEASREACRSLAYKISRTKTALDDAGKKVGDPAHKKWKAVTARRKKVTEALDELRKSVRKPLSDYEKAEEERIERVKAHIDGFRSLSSTAHTMDIARLEDFLERTKNAEIDEDQFQDMAELAETLKLDAIKALEDALDAAQEAEAERKELEELRAEKARRDDAEAAEAEKAETPSEPQSEPQSAETEPERQSRPATAAPALSGDAVLRSEALEDLSRVISSKSNIIGIDTLILDAILEGKIRHVSFR